MEKVPWICGQPVEHPIEKELFLAIFLEYNQLHAQWWVCATRKVKKPNDILQKFNLAIHIYTTYYMIGNESNLHFMGEKRKRKEKILRNLYRANYLINKIMPWKLDTIR